jgi:aminoglycoside phosphotransferase (APT) family kinase protein
VLAVARARDLPTDHPVVLANGANVVVRLAPAPVVAKAAASSRTLRDAGAFLAREVAVAAAVGAAGVPAVAPADPQVHTHGGVAVTLWEHVLPGDRTLPPPERVGAMLAELHAALRASDLELPRLAPLEDIPRFVARAGGSAAAMGEAYERLVATLPAGPDQPLHGDAHPGNLLSSPNARWLWCDFEDTCSGPIEWDLASLRRSPRLDGAAAVRAYARASGHDVDDAALAPWIELRELHLAVWLSLYAERGLPS